MAYQSLDNFVVGDKKDNGKGTFTYAGFPAGRGATGVSDAIDRNGRWNKAHAATDAYTVHVVLTSDIGGGANVPLVYPAHVTSMKMRNVKIATKPLIKQIANVYMRALS